MQAGALATSQVSQAVQLRRQTPCLAHSRSCSVVRLSRSQPCHRRPALCPQQPNSCRSARVQTRWICKAETEAAEAEDDEDEDIDPEDIAGVDGLDEDVEDIPEDSVGDRRDGRQLNAESSYDSERRDSRKSKYEERVIEVSRVTKVVKGGKQLGFRCVLAMGDEKGTVRFIGSHALLEACCTLASHASFLPACCWKCLSALMHVQFDRSMRVL